MLFGNWIFWKARIFRCFFSEFNNISFHSRKIYWSETRASQCGKQLLIWPTTKLLILEFKCGMTRVLTTEENLLTCKVITGNSWLCPCLVWYFVVVMEIGFGVVDGDKSFGGGSSLPSSCWIRNYFSELEVKSDIESTLAFFVNHWPSFYFPI